MSPDRAPGPSPPVPCPGVPEAPAPSSSGSYGGTCRRGRRRSRGSCRGRPGGHAGRRRSRRGCCPGAGGGGPVRDGCSSTPVRTPLPTSHRAPDGSSTTPRVSGGISAWKRTRAGGSVRCLAPGRRVVEVVEQRGGDVGDSVAGLQRGELRPVGDTAQRVVVERGHLPRVDGAVGKVESQRSQGTCPRQTLAARWPPRSAAWSRSPARTPRTRRPGSSPHAACAPRRSARTPASARPAGSAPASRPGPRTVRPAPARRHRESWPCSAGAGLDRPPDVPAGAGPGRGPQRVTASTVRARPAEKATVIWTAQASRRTPRGQVQVSVASCRAPAPRGPRTPIR